MTWKCVFGSVEIAPEGGVVVKKKAVTVREAAVLMWAVGICGTVRDFGMAMRMKARREVVSMADMVDLQVSRGVERIIFVSVDRMCTECASRHRNSVRFELPLQATSLPAVSVLVHDGS